MAVTEELRPRTSPAPRHWFLFCAVLGAFVLAKVTVSSENYVWTDVREISERALIRESASDLWSAIRFGVAGQYYRPTVLLLHTLTYWVFGDSPMAFRLGNLVIHLGNSVLVYLLSRRIGLSGSKAGATSILFAVHPLAATPLCWVSDRTDLLALTGAAASLLSTSAYVRRGHYGHLCFALVALVLGLGAKETTVVALGIVAVVAVFGRHSDRRRLTIATLLQGAVTTAWFIWRSHVATNPATLRRSLGVMERIALAGTTHLDYLRQLVYPSSLTVCDAARVPVPAALWATMSSAACVIAGTVLVRLWRGTSNRQWALAALWTAAFLLPTSGVVMLKHVRADRYLYDALPGLSVLAVLVANTLANRMMVRWRAKFVLLVGGLLYLSGSLLARAEQFSSDRRLWSFEVDENPDCREGWTHLLRDAYVNGDLPRARLAIANLDRVDERLVAFWDDRTASYYKALGWLDSGDFRKASLLFERLTREPRMDRVAAESAFQLGLLRLAAGTDFAGATSAMTTAITSGSLPPSSLGDAFLLRSYSRFMSGDHAAARADLNLYTLRNERPSSPTRKRIARELLRAYGG
jgi:hypothetical protein